MTWGIWQIFTRTLESLKIGTFMGFFYTKYKMYEVKNLQGSYVSWQRKMMQNLKRNWLVSSKLIWGMWRILAQVLKNLKILYFNWLLWNKVYNIWAKKVQRSYVWWYWILMQTLKENWLVLLKMTRGIWRIFTRALKSFKIGILMESF